MDCKNQDWPLTHQEGAVWRVVETQEWAATREITSDADAQLRLEQLLDQSKPALAKDCAHLSYLLATPFKYPPLDYGSRFGNTFERSIFYAAREQHTAFAESAVYLWLFQSGPIELGPLATIKDQRTAFSVTLASDAAMNLAEALDPETLARITAKGSWAASQTLGRELRERGAEFFWYPSARWPGGTNAAVMSPTAFQTREPHKQEHWQLRLDSYRCWFGRRNGPAYEFMKDEFMEEGRIPHPAL